MKGNFIPLNEIPEEMILNDESNDVKEKIELKSVGNQGNQLQKNNNEFGFVWGFFFFDIPNISVHGNKIYFTGEIHRDSVHEIKNKIIEVSKKLFEIYYETGEQIPIYLYINSPGGVVHAGFDLIDFIENYNHQIITIGTGSVASMGFMLLLSGKEKYLTPNSHILIHQVSTMIGGKRQDILDYVKHIEDLHKQFIEFIMKRTKLKRNEIETLLSKESWLSAEEALRLGIIDGIWQNK